MVGLENVSAALGRVEFADNFPLDLLPVTGLPHLDVAVPANAEAVAVLPAQLHGIHARLRLQGVVAINPDLDEVIEQLVYATTAVIDDRQTPCVRFVRDGLDPRFEVVTPVLGREKRPVPVRHVTPDHVAVQQTIRGIHGCPGALKIEFADPVDDRAHTFRVQAHPQHRVLLADEPGQTLRTLNHAAIDGKVGTKGFDPVYPWRRVALETVSHPGDLVVARLEEAPPIVRGIELSRFELLDGIRLPPVHLRHGVVEFLAHDGAETGSDDDFVLCLAQRFERADPGIHVRDAGDPVQVIVGVRTGILGQAEVFPPALGETAPEEVADWDAVGFLMAQGLAHAVQLGQRAFFSCSIPRFACRLKHPHCASPSVSRNPKKCLQTSNTGCQPNNGRMCRARRLWITFALTDAAP